MRARAAVAVWVFAAAATVAVAQEGPLDRGEQDRRTARVVHESVTIGIELYNAGNKEGCYRLFQGTLLAVQPMLDHRPKLADAVKQALDRAAALRDPASGAVELRRALDAVQLETSASFLIPKKDKDKGPEKDKTAGNALWDRLGGEPAVRAVVKDFIVAAAADPKVNVTRDGKYKLDEKGVARLEQTLVEFVSEKTGGPLKYTGKSMAAVHTGMKITDGEFNQMALHLVKTLEKHRVPLQERFDLVEILGRTRGDIVGK